MSTTKQQTQPAKEGALSPFFKPVSLCLSALWYLLVALTISIIIEWVGISFWWPSDHANTVLQQELHFLGENFTTSVAGESPAGLATAAALIVRSALTQNTFVLWLNDLHLSQQTSTMLRALSGAVQAMTGYAEAALFVTLTICVRVTVIVLASPILILVALVSALDGLVERALRKVGGDREHSRIVHLALYWSPKLAIIAPVLYLAWPGMANPIYFFLPAMAIYGLTNYVLVSQYQKEL